MDSGIGGRFDFACRVLTSAETGNELGVVRSRYNRKMLRTLAVGVLLGSFCFGASILNSNVVDTTQYRVTTFASALSLPLCLIQLLLLPW